MTTSYDSDQGRELRRARLRAIQPKNAPYVMKECKFNRTFKQFHVVARDQMPKVEEERNLMFCPACQKQYDETLVLARRLYVVYEPDPLRNYPAVARTECKGCGWEEIIPIEAPAPLTQEEQEALRSADQIRSTIGMQQVVSGLGGGGGGVMHNPFSNAGMDALAAQQQQRLMNSEQQLRMWEMERSRWNKL